MRSDTPNGLEDDFLGSGKTHLLCVLGLGHRCVVSACCGPTLILELAEEYDDETNWPCTAFSTSYGEFIPQGSGTENGLHNGYGFIDSRLPTGFSLIEQHFNTSFRINSGYRCPKGNGVTPGAGTLSKHMLGLAVDFQELGWPAGTTERKRQIKEWTEDPNGAGAGFVQFYSDKTHMHADWR